MVFFTTTCVITIILKKDLIKTTFKIGYIEILFILVSECFGVSLNFTPEKDDFFASLSSQT